MECTTDSSGFAASGRPGICSSVSRWIGHSAVFGGHLFLFFWSLSKHIQKHPLEQIQHSSLLPPHPIPSSTPQLQLQLRAPTIRYTCVRISHNPARSGRGALGRSLSTHLGRPSPRLWREPPLDASAARAFGLSGDHPQAPQPVSLRVDASVDFDRVECAAKYMPFCLYSCYY